LLAEFAAVAMVFAYSVGEGEGGIGEDVLEITPVEFGAKILISRTTLSHSLCPESILRLQTLPTRICITLWWKEPFEAKTVPHQSRLNR
jgi:hypothetical protein